MRDRLTFRQGVLRLAVSPAVFVSILFLSSSVWAQWPSSPLINLPICTAVDGQLNSVAVSDGAGGAIIAWVDARPPVADGLSIYAQHVNAAGVIQWAIDGIPICVAPGDQLNPSITSDGAGGAIIAWQDGRPSPFGLDIYAQHITAAGVATWPVDGVPVCSFVGDQIWPMLVTDTAGGAIITWEDERAGPGLFDIYAQRINAAGALLWPPLVGGVAIGVAPLLQLMPMIVEDGAGGAIITWYDNRTGINFDIYAQHVTALGATTWLPVGGVLVCGPPIVPAGDQDQPTIATDGAGGAIITWQDTRVPLLGSQIYAQHVSAAGAVTWAGGVGVPVCAIIGDQFLPKIVSDAAGGAIITWQDGRPPLALGTSIYAQHVDGLGAALWAVDGIPICTMPGDQNLPKIVSDDAGGAIIAWNDERSLISFDIYAQRVSPLGVPLWPPVVSGVPVSTAPFDQEWAFQFIPMVADGNNGAIISWSDLRLAIATDIYAQNINRDGSLGVLPVGYWRLEEGAGTTAADASGNGNDGSLAGPAAFTTDVPCGTVIVQSSPRTNGYSLNFPITEPPVGEVTIPDDATLRPANAITVEAWIRPSSPTGPIVSKQFYYEDFPILNDVSSYLLGSPIIGSGGMRFALSDATGNVTEIAGLAGTEYPIAGEWTHVAGTWDSDSGTMRLYMNFVEIASGAFAGPIGYDSHDVQIGARNNGPDGDILVEWFLGDIDEVRVSNIARTPDDMLRTTCPLAPIVVVQTPASLDTVVGYYDTDITWTAFDDGGVASIMIEVTNDGGGTYDTLATGEPNDGSYTWAVPPINSSPISRVRVTAYDGAANARSSETSGFYVYTPPPTGIGSGGPPPLSLSAHPNPFNPSLTVDYSIPASGPVEIAVFDVRGRRVDTLVKGVMPAGERVATWNGHDARGAPVTSGVYFVRLTHGGKTEVRKTVLLK